MQHLTVHNRADDDPFLRRCDSCISSKFLSTFIFIYDVPYFSPVVPLSFFVGSQTEMGYNELKIPNVKLVVKKRYLCRDETHDTVI